MNVLVINSETFVIIGTGPDETPSVQIIDKVKTQAIGMDAALTIYSTDLDGAHYQMALQFSPANGGEIRIGNQTHVWKRYSDNQDRTSTSH